MASSKVCIDKLCNTRYMYTHSRAVRRTLISQRFLSVSICNMPAPIYSAPKAPKKPRRSKKKTPSIRPDPPHHTNSRTPIEKISTLSRPSSSQEKISRLILDQRLRFDKLKRRDDMLLMEEVCNVPRSQREFINQHMSKSTESQTSTQGKRRTLLPSIEYFAIWLETNLVVFIQNIVQRVRNDLSSHAPKSTNARSQASPLSGSSLPSSSQSPPSGQFPPSFNRPNRRRHQTLHDAQLRTLDSLLRRVSRLATENRLVNQPRIILLHHLQSDIPSTPQIQNETPSRSSLLSEALPQSSFSSSPRPSRRQRSLSKISPRPINALWSRYLCMIPFPVSPLYNIIFHSLVWDRDCILLLVRDIRLPKNLPRDPNNKTFERAVWNLPPEGMRGLFLLTVWKSKRVDGAHVTNVALKAKLDERRARERFPREVGGVGVQRRRPTMGIGDINWLRIRGEQGETVGTFAGKSID